MAVTAVPGNDAETVAQGGIKLDSLNSNALTGITKYLARNCPRCAGYLEIVLQKSDYNTRLQGINGHCLDCGYRLAWILVRGGKSVRHFGTVRRLSY